MPDYKKMYLTLFHTMTDVMEEMQISQQNAEDIYVSDYKKPIKVEVKRVPNNRLVCRRRMW